MGKRWPIPEIGAVMASRPGKMVVTGFDNPVLRLSFYTRRAFRCRRMLAQVLRIITARR
jgi:hypothetical protein